MSKSDSICVRDDPAIYYQAVSLLSEMGIPMSVALDMFWRQIIFTRSLPFLPVVPRSEINLQNSSENALLENLTD